MNAKTKAIKIDGFITYTQHTWEKVGEGSFSFRAYKPLAEYEPDTVVVREHSITVEVPTKYDPRAAMVANFEEQKTLLRAAFNLKIKELNEQISKLQAIEYVEAQS